MMSGDQRLSDLHQQADRHKINVVQQSHVGEPLVDEHLIQQPDVSERLVDESTGWTTVKYRSNSRASRFIDKVMAAASLRDIKATNHFVDEFSIQGQNKLPTISPSM